MDPWKSFHLHLVVAVLATLGAGLGLLDNPSAARTAWWFACLSAALYNGVLFGVGWQRNRETAHQR